MDTVKPKTPQETFDTVASHLLAQNRQAVSADGPCQYRIVVGPDTLTCAVGCLIPEARYSPDLEGAVIILDQAQRDKFEAIHPKCGQLREVPVLEGYGLELWPLLRSLQHVHDLSQPDAWRVKLFDVAEAFKLSPAVIERKEGELSP